MGLKDFTLSDAIRFSFSPVIFLFYLYLYQPDTALILIKKLGTANIILASLVVGSAMFFLYRTVINEIIMYLHDKFRNIQRKIWNVPPSARQFVLEEFELSRSESRYIIWKVCHKHIFKRFPTMRLWISGIHFLYLGASIGFFFFFITLIIELAICPQMWIIFVIFMVFFLAGSWSDYRCDTFQYRLLSTEYYSKTKDEANML